MNQGIKSLVQWLLYGLLVFDHTSLFFFSTQVIGEEKCLLVVVLPLWSYTAHFWFRQKVEQILLGMHLPVGRTLFQGGQRL